MLSQLKNDTNDPFATHSNVMVLKAMHGDVVAFIHIIAQTGEQTTHLFFFDGYIHTISSLFYGIPEEENEQQFFIFLTILNEIPLMAGLLQKNDPISIFVEKGEEFVGEKNVSFVFRPPLSIIPRDHIIHKSKGIENLDEMTSIIYQDDNAIILEGIE